MNDLRTAAQQALEVINDTAYGAPVFRQEVRDTIAALRAALAQQAEPVQEPVAWSGYDLDGMVEAFSRVIEAHYQRANPFQHPIDMDAQMALRILRGFIPAMKAYAVPPQRKPLTEEMEARCPYAKANPTLRGAFFDGWLNSERAHGIKE